ncbi:acyltransferase family protein [Sphingobium sp. Cam5-1]|uniref:acyltransferase family protein n=1 Tax=Sphingobium sp. Cam5-1 TaxID=2789327 RepID=UPI0018AD1198|nr:acyltransferase [Sphingobium sp. Cam5-1]QPI73942.1 acyltransferase [Sphingobium sp. Cam5-1]
MDRQGGAIPYPLNLERQENDVIPSDASRSAASKGEHSALKYRREIDGLRALAVLPVMFFHAGVTALSGGFVGVDIFFVISGYLITSIIIGEMRSEKGFSIARFYERRARRILPALYLVLACSTVMGWFLLVPDQLENFGQSLFATTAFSNNLLLAFTAGYWDVLTELKPLVHTWSLGVEEQFYFAFPVLLILMRKQPAKLVIAFLVAAGIGSLALAEATVRGGGSGLFFLPHTRAWELLFGSLCAYQLQGKGPTRNDFGALIGVLMIAYAILTFDSQTPFPSAWGLIPVIGTALIILFATHDSWVGRCLSFRPVVAIGLISYSAYLWHQPVFAFARAYSQDRPDALALSLMVPVALLLAYLSWRFVEAPFRDRGRVSVKAMICIFGPASIAFLGIGLGLSISKGAPSRLPQAMAEGSRSSEYNSRVFRFKENAFVSDKPVRLLVVGDSFGRDLVNMVLETYGDDKVEIIYRDDLKCPAGSNLAAQSHVIFVTHSLKFDADCIAKTLPWASANGKHLFYFGSKNFGTNISWIMRTDSRANLHNRPDMHNMHMIDEMRALVPDDRYVPVMERIMKDGRVPFTDAAGNLLSNDTRHLTKAGAIYVGKAVFEDLRLKDALSR